MIRKNRGRNGHSPIVSRGLSMEGHTSAGPLGSRQTRFNPNNPIGNSHEEGPSSGHLAQFHGIILLPQSSEDFLDMINPCGFELKDYL